MKLIVAIVDNQDADKVVSALTEQRIGVTRVSSTGGLIGPGNSTLLIGVDESRIDQAKKIVSETAAVRTSFAPYAQAGIMPGASYIEVEVGGYITFVLNIDHFEQV